MKNILYQKFINLFRSHFKHTFRIMRITFILLFVCTVGSYAIDAESQTAKVNIARNNTTVKKVITDIEEQTDYLFVYSKKEIPLNEKISINVNDESVASVLKRMFNNTDIVYAIEGNNIMLMKNIDLQQENKRVSGKVVDENGESITGANVSVKGSTIGTITDIDGNFTLNIPVNAALSVTYIGYISQEIAVGNRDNITIKMIENTKQLEEVVVVGYGVQKKVNLTGAISSVSGEQLTKRPVTNPVTMLQGQVPGLNITQGLGQPGNESVTMRVRGLGTYSGAGSNPLVLIDGVSGSMNNLNPNDIESVSVLKDASSAAIYGSRAANGVILITTKTGQEGQFKLSYNVNVGAYSPTRMLDLVTNSADYMRLANEAKLNSGIATAATTYTDAMIAAYENPTDPAQYPSFDWLGYAFNTAWVQNHSLSLTGGAKGTTYNLSLGYVDQPGTMMGYDYKKYNFRLNLKSQLKDWITIGSNIALERGDREQPNQGQDDAFLSFLAQMPTYTPWLPDRSGYTSRAYTFETGNKNMVAGIKNGVLQNDINYDASAQLWAEVKPFKDLTWYTKGAVNYTNNQQKNWKPTVPLYNFHTKAFMNNLDVGTIGLNVNDNNTLYTNFYTYLLYNKTLAADHNFGLQVGYSQEYYRYDILKGYRKTFYSDLHELDAGTAPDQTTGGTAYEWALMSFFGRFNYDYKGRYMFEANARYDGTSRMSKDNRWGLFPSFSAGWRLSEESFIKDLDLTWLNNFKIRGNYGKLGNQNVSVSDQPYPYQSLMAYTGAYPFDNSVLSAGVAQTVAANQNIKWETTTSTDIGVDVTLFKGLSITYDWYRKNTTDILRTAQTSALLGLTAPIINSGAMVNYGHEVSVQYAGIIKNGPFKEFNYTIGASLDKNNNEAKNFGTEEIDGYYLRRNGLPYNSYYLLECIGVFQTEEEIKNSPKQFSDVVKPGDLKYKDVSGPNGVPDGVVDNYDRTVVSGKYEKFGYSFNASASWKGFDFSILFQGIEGRKIFVQDWGYTPFRQGTPPTKEWLTDRWTGPGTSNWLPRITWDYTNNSQNRRPSTWFLQDASYLRLKNLTFGYTIPRNITDKFKCEKLRVYFSGDNLFTITDYTGLDPERAGDGRFAQYPQNKIVSFGLNVEF